MSNIDLHGKTWTEALAEFLDLYNRTVARSGASNATLDVVHGYGSTGSGGVLRRRIRAFLAKYPQCLEFKPGEDIDSNPGHTLISPMRPLPDTGGLLAEHIWEYCESPRTVNKIAGRFRRYGDPQVQQAILTLQKQGRLRPLSKGRFKEYGAV
jgi:hypothetical protein